eukprot:2717945-Rhodomonas_salina.1
MKWQKRIRVLYDSVWFESLVGFVVIGNFVLNAVQAETEPLALGDKSQASAVYEKLDICFTVFFLVELALNMFSRWFWDYFTDVWCMFDLVVILCSAISLALEQLASVSILRVFRAIRVLRLIRRFSSLRTIMHSIRLSIIPVLNALLMVMIVLAIYTIFGVYLFVEDSPENFGAFTLSLCTLFNLMAFQVWPREMSSVRYDTATGTHSMDLKVFLFIVSFTAIVTWTLLQVVVAVLLDNFMESAASEK